MSVLFLRAALSLKYMIMSLEHLIDVDLKLSKFIIGNGTSKNYFHKRIDPLTVLTVLN